MRVQVDAKFPKHIQLQPMFAAKRELRARGVEFTTEKPDLLLLHVYRQTKEYVAAQLDRGIPTVLLERIASANVHCRKEISRPNVGAVAKSTTFRDWRLNNAPAVKGRYHFQLMGSEEGESARLSLTEETASKIALWYHFGFYTMMDPFIAVKIDYSRPRKWAAMFAGTTNHAGQCLVDHRAACCRAMQDGPHECFVEYSRAISKTSYVKVMCNSYCSPSPWGLGEKCYRDFEGIYAGSVVIKPDTRFVLDITDTYHPDNKYILPCKMDHSDLNERITEVLDNWQSFAARCEVARDTMIRICKDKSNVADIVHGVFEKALQRC